MMVNTDYTVKWINEFVEELVEADTCSILEHMADHDNLRVDRQYKHYGVKVSIHTGEGGVWIAEVTQGGYVLIDSSGEYIMRGHGDTIVEALNDLDSRCRVDLAVD